MQPSIAILGAGPAGLALARLLELHSISYIVYERDISPSTCATGGTLDIHAEDGQEVLREAGLHDEFASLARYDGQEFTAVDAAGNVVWRKEYDGQTDRPEIDRVVLREMLLRSVPGDKMRWGAKVESVRRDEHGGVSIRFVDGAEESGFKLVVGADGAWSKARPAVTSAKPVFSGLYYLQTTIQPSNPQYAAAHAMVGAGSYMAITDGVGITAQQVGSGAYNIYVGVRAAEDWAKQNAELLDSPAQCRTHLLDTYFSTWNSDVRSLIAHSDAAFRPWPLYNLPADSQGWTSVPGITLLGDAAHLATPNGEGVNLAMYDALCLARGIVRCGVDKVDEAVRQYEKDMFVRGRASIEEGEKFADMFWAADAPRGFREWVAAMPGNE